MGATNVSVKTNALSRLNHWRTHHKRFADFLAYIAISLAFTTAIVIAAIKGISYNPIGKSFLFLIFTALVFTHFVQGSREFWKRAAFWWLTAVLFLLHSGLWFAVLKRLDSLPRGLFLIVIVIAALLFERKLFQFVRDSILRREKHHYFTE
jgi:hypothetical protein